MHFFHLRSRKTKQYPPDILTLVLIVYLSEPLNLSLHFKWEKQHNWKRSRPHSEAPLPRPKMHSECGINNRPNPLHPKFFLPKRSPPDIEANFLSLSLLHALLHTLTYTHLQTHTYTHSLSFLFILFHFLRSYLCQMRCVCWLCIVVPWRKMR